MAIPPADFFNIFSDEGVPDYSAIPTTQKDNFNNWITQNFLKFKTINSYDEVTPSEELYKEMVAKGYVHRGPQCHYTAKALTLIDNRFDFFTGFVKRSDFIYPIITHSFNFFEGKLIDFTRYNFVNEYNTDYFPHTYYGMKIPIYFIEKYRKVTIEEYSMNPLLIDWYKH